MQKELFHKCAERWAKWWQLHWKEHVSDPYYSRVGLTPLSATESNLRSESPEGQTKRIYGRFGGVLDSAHKRGAQPASYQHTFQDLDTGRVGQLPEFLRSAEHEPERTDDILAWAATEGFDIMCTEYRIPGQAKPRYVLRGLGLVAWQIEGEQERTLGTDISLERPLKVGRRTESLLAHFDAATGQHVTNMPATFLFRTREGTYGAITVGVESTVDSPEQRFDCYLIAGKVTFAGTAGR